MLPRFLEKKYVLHKTLHCSENLLIRLPLHKLMKPPFNYQTWHIIKENLFPIIQTFPLHKIPFLIQESACYMNTTFIFKESNGLTYTHRYYKYIYSCSLYIHSHYIVALYIFIYTYI